MAASRRSRWALILAFLSLTTLWGIEAADAQLSLFWRAAVLSWDSPATQLQDGVATQGFVETDDARRLRDHVRAALGLSGRLGAPPDPGSGSRPALASRLTRAPPRTL